MTRLAIKIVGPSPLPSSLRYAVASRSAEAMVLSSYTVFL
ncbi:MAG: hypothetical protein PeribacterA2_0853 [Candidatus Peribacter riflensis]|uniref:Uncharacterized protein n=1 Tax=Candidatus Peribacter riflensis TaxID=1735162 RepID=A0A0S1SQE6_9BACT|nr:MAG: hypothetical protein PeribacterA2_0853 [Candidatus Peribacter riflensis]ALM11319.1 MAG: hypothetical protein PeribacterB2_0855 [Candidatus Peribacter riflensis]ALM12421.1 MAG: hypothetical protein PeribacterC2_0854 [Candidatus Peribacter riflensis]ALM13522.1 MAG: hypothetical protein PeribacterD1_0853 [Candidatus Peribacter riflensis]ALM14623.1 MAG: hypothetical protein PeribacterD2_0853 [Candidatus Peribacter riflensis]